MPKIPKPRRLGTSGAALLEYAILVATMTVAVIGGALAIGNMTTSHYHDVAFAVEKPLLVETGFVSKFKEQKVLGIAKDYKGRVTFIHEEAGYRSAVGMYRFDAEGTVTDVEILFPNASQRGSGGDLIPGESHVDVDLSERDQIGFFLASNGYSRNNRHFLESGKYQITEENGDPATIHSDGLLFLMRLDEDGTARKIRTQYAHNLFYSHADPDDGYTPNVDGYPHTVGFVHQSSGIVTLGFEDLIGGGDNDYDDIILEFDVGRSNAAVLDPNLDYDYDGYDTWVDKLRLSDSRRFLADG